MIAGQGITKSFATQAGEVSALRGVDFAASAGDCLGLMGASGSGKSTLINILSGVLTADAGQVRGEGLDLTGATSAQRAAHRLRHVGVIFQDHRLIPEFSVLENVSLPSVTLGLSLSAATARAKSALEQVGLAGMGSRRPHELSLGQQQRVGIATHDPLATGFITRNVTILDGQIVDAHPSGASQ